MKLLKNSVESDEGLSMQVTFHPATANRADFSETTIETIVVGTSPVYLRNRTADEAFASKSSLLHSGKLSKTLRILRII